MGSAGIFGGLLEGYMKGTSERQAKKMEEAKALMGMAKEFAELRDTATTPLVREHAEQQFHQYMGQAEKAMNRKSVGYSMLSKILGWDGKGKQDVGVGMASEAAVQGEQGRTGETQGAVPSQEAAPAAEAIPAAGQLAGPPETALPGPRETQGVPERTMVSEAPTPALPTEGRPMGLTSLQAGPKPRVVEDVPGVARQVDGNLMIGNRAVNNREYNQFVLGYQQRAAQIGFERADREYALKTQKEFAVWQADEADRRNQKRATDFASSTEGQRMAKDNPRLFQNLQTMLRWDVKPSELQGRIAEYETTDDAGNITKRTVDTATGRDLVPPQNVPPNPYQQKARAYVLSGKAKNFAQGERMVADEYLSDEEAKDELKQQQIEKNKIWMETQKQLQDMREKRDKGVISRAAYAQWVVSQAMKMAQGSGEIRDQYGSIIGHDADKAMATMIKFAEIISGESYEQIRKDRGYTGKEDLSDSYSNWYLRHATGQVPSVIRGGAGAQIGTTGKTGAWLPGTTPKAGKSLTEPPKGQ